MKISEILRNSSKAFPSIEIVPPLKGMSAAELVESIKPFMEFRPPYVNVTCHRDEFEFIANPDGTFTRRMVQNRISEVAVAGMIMSNFRDTEAVPHIICAGATKEKIQSELDDLHYMGIENVLALRGDCLASEKRFSPTPGGYAFASELVEGIRSYRSELGHVYCIGVGAYPEKHFEAPNLETDIQNLKKKVDAGADYIITQMFFDNKVYYDFVDKCRKAGISVPIIPGLKPLTSARQLTLLPEAFSIDIPLELSTELSAHKDDKEACYEIGQLWCKAQCRDLLAHGVPAVHFYTMGRAGNIVNIMRECF